MILRRVSIASILSGWLVGGVLAVAPPDQPASRPGPDPKVNTANISYWGIITSISKDSISIQFADEDPKKFAVSKDLADGQIPMKARPMPGVRPYHVAASSMYRLTDVRKGDWVVICYAHIDNQNICDHISILKRPGGRVPPLPDEAESLRMPKPIPGVVDMPHLRYDELRNAHWDLVDKGIPYPEKFGPARRWPVAPMPREVKSPRSSP